MFKNKRNFISGSVYISVLAGVMFVLGMRTGCTQTTQVFRVYKKEVAGKIPETSEAIAAGKKIYEKRCYYCHGIKGDGNGSDAPRLDPKPRNFTRNEYKIRSTALKSLPTDEDLFRIISSGVEGTAMPFWHSLTPTERWQVIYYIKTFNGSFKDKSAPAEVTPGAGSASTPESVARGKKLFREARCFLCHGEEGRGDGKITKTLKKQWGLPYKARDLTKSWLYKGGNDQDDIFRTLSTGLNETPMGSYSDYLTEEDRWHLVHYVKSISHDMNTEVVLKSKLVTGLLPKGPDDEAWDTISSVELPLAGQIVASPRHWNPSVNSVQIKSFYNKENIAFLLVWDDRTNEQNEIYSDAAAIQFPTKIPEALEKPYFGMGDSGKSVELLHWRAFDESAQNVNGGDGEESETETDGGTVVVDESEKADEGMAKEEAVTGENESAEIAEVAEPKDVFQGFASIMEKNAKGFKKLSVQPEESQNSQGKSIWENGRWKLMITRPLHTGDEKTDIQFEKGKLIPYALAVWDGSNGERAGQKSISSWYYMTLEMTTPKSVYLYAIIAVLMGACVQFWVVARIRRFPPKATSE